MNQTFRYEYQGHNIVINYNNNELGNGFFKPSDISLYIDGVRQSFVPRRETANTQLSFSFADKHGHIELAKKAGVHTQSLVIDGEKLVPTQENQVAKLDLDNLRTLSQYPLIANLNVADFLAFKCVTPNAISSSSSRSTFYLRVTKDAEFPWLDNDCRLDSTGFRPYQNSDANFVKIRFTDIRPGDDIVVVEQRRLGGPKISLIENVACTTSFGCPDYIKEFIDKGTSIGIIEGANKTWTSFDAEQYFDQKIRPTINEAGLTVEQLAEVFTPTTSYDEFISIRTLFEHGIAITDSTLQRVASGDYSLKYIIESEELLIGDHDGLEEHDITIGDR